MSMLSNIHKFVNHNFLPYDWKVTETEQINDLSSELTAIALAMRLNVRASKLMNECGIHYENNRTHAGRTITLTLTTQET